MAESQSGINMDHCADIMDDKKLREFTQKCLYRCFCNYVYLGQWHLAQACASIQGADTELAGGHVTEEQDIQLLLRQLVENAIGSR